MNYKNIASILTNQLLKNEVGESVTVAEDLSNVVEVAKAISSLSTDDVKNVKKNLVVGVHNYVVTRLLESKQFKLWRDNVEFGGLLQRLTASTTLPIQESHLLNLVNGTSYLDGKYYGMDVSSRVVTNTDTFKVVHSISDDEFSQYFINAEETAKFISLIEVTEQNTITKAVKSLEKRVLTKLAYDTYKNGRKVELLTEFNTKTGKTYTLTDIAEDRLLMSYFSDFCKEVIERVKTGMKNFNRKYNDGTIETFANEEDINLTLISEFANDIKYLGNPVTFNTPTTPNYDEITSWQNNSDDLLPDYTHTTTITVVDTDEETGTDTITNIVGMCYDILSASVCTVRDKITVEPVGAEGFTNFHHHMANKYFVDSRFGAVVFTLD